MCASSALRLLLLTLFAFPLSFSGACRSHSRASLNISVQEGRPGEMYGWLSWRGLHQNGTCDETDLIEDIELDGKNQLWSYPLRGRGTPVIANGRVFAMAYSGEGPDLQERIICLDEKSGELLWERKWNDFLTDIIYDRYAIASPTIDPQTGNVYFLSSAAILTACTRDGELLWQIPMASEYGRLSFPNGRTGSPVIDGDLVICHLITSSWGSQGPARDRFFAFEKETGVNVWSCTPGTGPKDSSFSMPVIAEANGRRVLYAGTGCGHVVCIDVRTGETLWRFRMAVGGVNSAVVLHGQDLIAIHGKENIDSSTLGRMVCLPTGSEPEAGKPGPRILGHADEKWRTEAVAFTSSPVLVGDRVYQTVATGELLCIDANTGEHVWSLKLAADQIHASPIFADGKLYVPMTNGSFHIVKIDGEEPEVLDTVQLEGSCLGAPAIANGRIYVHTTEKLYCFGDGKSGAPAWNLAGIVAPGEASDLQLVPGDFLMRVGDEVPIRLRSLDRFGRVVDPSYRGHTSWAYMRPPIITRTPEWKWRALEPGSGVIEASFRHWNTSARVRVVPKLPYTLDFEETELTQGGGSFAFPPGHWLSAKPKWKIVEREGDKVLERNMSNPLFQRALSRIGHPEDRNYTVQMDILSDGNRRTQSSGGFVNQRYLFQLNGNYQEIQISSNDERIRERVGFKWKPGTWYTLKGRVDVAPDGSGVVRAKAWKRGDDEPAAWSLEVPHANAHRTGSPGLFGFTPQSRFTIYLDNIQVTLND